MRINPAILFSLAVPFFGCTNDPQQTDDPEIDTIANCGLDGTITLPTGSPKTAGFTKLGNANCGALVKVNMTQATAKIINGMVCPETNHLLVYTPAGEWGLMSDSDPNDEAECKASSLVVTIKNSSGTVIAQKTEKPQWLGGECGLASTPTIDVSSEPDTYTVSASAFRGSQQSGLGFGREVVTASRTSSCN